MSSQNDPHRSGAPTFGVCCGPSDHVLRPGRRLPRARTWRRNTATFYDAKGNFVGSSVASPGRSTNFFGRDGSFQGTLSRTGDRTNFFDRAGRYMGSVTTLPAPGSDRKFNFKKRY
jgi:hypothetical protein